MRVDDWLPAAVRAKGVERKLKTGEALFHLGDKPRGLYEVIKGRVRLARIDRSGRETVLYVAGAGDIVAEASLFSPTYHCDAVANTDAVVRVYPKATVLDAFAKESKAAQAFTATLAHQLMDMRTRLELRNIHSARERVRHFLALNADADGRAVSLGGTLKEVASELGLTHEAFYRTLSALERAGEIKRESGRLTLLRRRRAERPRS
jgi:CRP/FNR family transcriptional regulator, dissimilatory nitrate respiration regulator